MLVLTRKVGESVTIGTDVTIRVIRFNGNQVRLGIEAPDWVKVMRAELQAPLGIHLPLDRPPAQEEIPGASGRTPG